MTNRPLSRQREDYVVNEAMNFVDAYEVPVDHPGDEPLRDDFASALEKRIEKAVVDTHEEFSPRAQDLARERPTV